MLPSKLVSLSGASFNILLVLLLLEEEEDVEGVPKVS